MVKEEVIPDIKQKCSLLRQQANLFAPRQRQAPHDVIIVSDIDGPELMAASGSKGFSIQLTNQSTNSPDTNVLGLQRYFFPILYSPYKTVPLLLKTSIDHLVTAVNNAWAEEPPHVLGRVWLSLLAILQDYYKSMRRQRGNFPSRRVCGARLKLHCGNSTQGV